MTKLITYPDSLGGNLKELAGILENEFDGVFDGVHILPPYPSSGDRGFAPIDYKKIDPRFGSWEDLSELAAKYELTLDFMVNHASAQSNMAKDLLKNGKDSEFYGFFLTPEDVFSKHNPSEEDLRPVVLRRAKPYSDYKTDSGDNLRIWTTFGSENPSEQLDLNISSPKVKEYYLDLFEFFSSKGIKQLRMDAIAYAVKKAGTSCFFVEPEIFEFMDWIEAEANKFGIDILHEIHSPLVDVRKLAERGYKNYDFILSYAIFQALILQDAGLALELLRDEMRPNKWVTLIDCHDGIPVQPDMNGVLNEADMVKTVGISEKNGAIFTALHSAEKAYENAPNVHQICGSLYSLLGENDDAFVIARAIQLFSPGTPQVYYEGLLGGTHHKAGYEATKDGRELNRRNYSRADVQEALKRERTKRLFELIKYRNSSKFFEGEFTVEIRTTDDFNLLWNLSNGSVSLHVDLKSLKAEIIEDINGETRVFAI